MKNSSLIENDSLKLLGLVRKINIYSSLFVTIIGLIGNSLITYIYASKKRRTNSSHVYLLCSAINDNLFLIVHLFEDTLKTYIDVYSIERDHFLEKINIVEMNNIQCQFINYLRNILRFVSAYIVVAFTIQRLFIVSKPLTNKFKSNKSAWKTVLIIIIISILFNIWVPFIFKINDENQNCDVDRSYSSEYFYINLNYTFLILAIPIVIVLICNVLIFLKLKKSDKERKKLQHTEHLNNNNRSSSKIPRSPGYPNLSEFANTPRLSKVSSLNIKSNNINEQLIRSTRNIPKSTKKITLQLYIVSLSFLILNLPYLIGWFAFYFKSFFDQINSVSKIKLFFTLQISQIFYILYYGIKFYIFYLTSSEFRNSLTKTGKLIIVFKT
jgi:hypothetical protein